MRNETAHPGVLEFLVRWIAALGANASERAPLEGAGLRLAKIVNDIEEIARQQAELTAGSRKLRAPKSPKPPNPAKWVPPAAHPPAAASARP